MTHEAPVYGLWSLVVINIAIFAIFAYSFTRPRTARDWRSFGAFTGFVAALFVEMYGFPLTIYVLAGWLQRRYPGLDLLSHDAGHLWGTLLGWRGNPHLNPLHLLSNVLIAGGFIALARSWPVLYAAQRQGGLATTGPYAYVRHPQYPGLHRHHAGIPAPVAHAPHRDHVSDPRLGLCTVGATRGGRGAGDAR